MRDRRRSRIAGRPRYCRAGGIGHVSPFDPSSNANGQFNSAMREQYMRTGEGFLLVYSITSRNSFEEISTFHQQILRVKDQDSFPVIVVANKCDLEYERQVGMNEGRDLAKHFGCKFIETSAKQRINVDEAFCNLVREIRKYNKEQQTGRPVLPGGGGMGGSGMGMGGGGGMGGAGGRGMGMRGTAGAVGESGSREGAGDYGRSGTRSEATALAGEGEALEDRLL
ncbi:Ras GTPase [Salix suchowensis]|nr:Ras GTPase [Salix suchowensis]